MKKETEMTFQDAMQQLVDVAIRDKVPVSILWASRPDMVSGTHNWTICDETRARALVTVFEMAGARDSPIVEPGPIENLGYRDLDTGEEIPTPFAN